MGIAYKLTDKTVLRMAYGIFYGTFSNSGGGEYKETQPPFHFKVGLASDPRVPEFMLKDGLPAGSVTAANARDVEMSTWDMTPDWPMAQNWNFNLQYSLPGDALWEIGYFGNKMNHMLGALGRQRAEARRGCLGSGRRKAVSGGGGVNQRRPWRYVKVPSSTRGDLEFPGNEPGEFLTLGRSNTHSNRWNSLYHGFQTKVEKRYSKGMTYIASYSWSHAIGDWRAIPGSGGAPGENARLVLDVLDLTRERGPTPQDMRHRFVGSIVYELPFGQQKRWGSGWGHG